MQIDNDFAVNAPPDVVYAYLLDVNRVAGCLPGAEVSEVVDPDTFKGKVKIKVGPITVAYNGTARITERDAAQRLAKISADGRETTGPGSARATATMTVAEVDGGTSVVKLATDFTVAGRVANFGRGVMEDVSRRLVTQMAECIKANVETDSPAVAPAAADTAAGDAGSVPVADGAAASAQFSPPAAPAPPAVQAKPVNALGLFFAIIWDRIKSLFRRS
ncbi:MAG: SRPBCC family protein [Candidatus Dormibacteraeota bacterium]|nr:SRPBCC family protein [Candidatus Dormibacteraeota bacterium]